MNKRTNNKGILWGIAVVLALVALLFMIPTSSGQTQLDGKGFIEKFLSTSSNAVLLDVRTPAEFSAGHIDKAVNIDFENQSFESDIKKLDTSKTYFVYCRSGNRSGKSIAVMKNNGFKNIYELRGGVSTFPELVAK